MLQQRKKKGRNKINISWECVLLLWFVNAYEFKKKIFRYISLLGIHALEFSLKKEIKNKV